jgi:hypothetical protein
VENVLTGEVGLVREAAEALEDMPLLRRAELEACPLVRDALALQRRRVARRASGTAAA